MELWPTPRSVKFTAHAVRQMATRQISVDDVLSAMATGTTATDYPDDKPYPSRLMLGWRDGRPIHVVVAYDSSDMIAYVVTVYVPDPARWSDDFLERKNE